MRKQILTAGLGLALSLGVWAQGLTLEVYATPDDALIFVDREMKGKGKAIVSDLTPGEHLVRVAGGEDYEPVTRTINMQQGVQTLQFRLVPSGKRLIESGRRRLAAGNLDQACLRFQQAIATQPVTGNWWLGVASFLGKDYPSARKALREYAQFTSEAPQLHLLLGRIHQLENHPDQAFTAYKAALLKKLPHALDKLPEPTYQAIARLGSPTQAADQLRLGQLLMLKGNHADATIWAAKAVQKVFPDWENQDWNKFEPPVPKGSQPEVAPPEDSMEPSLNYGKATSPVPGHRCRKADQVSRQFRRRRAAQTQPEAGPLQRSDAHL